jgi:hypothetical protein
MYGGTNLSSITVQKINNRKTETHVLCFPSQPSFPTHKEIRNGNGRGGGKKSPFISDSQTRSHLDPSGTTVTFKARRSFSVAAVSATDIVVQAMHFLILVCPSEV